MMKTKLNKNFIETLRKVSVENEISKFDRSYIKIELKNLEDNFAIEDEAEMCLIKIASYLVSDKFIKDGIVEALKGAVYLVDLMIDQCGTMREFYTINSLNNKGILSEVVNAIYHIRKFKNTECILNIFAQKDREYVISIIENI